MGRLGRNQVVMIGLLQSCTETKRWSPGAPVQRTINITGADFFIVFDQARFYSKVVMKYSEGAAALGPGALNYELDIGAQNESLEQVGQDWWAFMKGLEGRMGFSYQGQTLYLSDFIATAFQNYPGLPIEVPAAENFWRVEGTWSGNFRSWYMFPFFEWFITTAPEGAYGQSGGSYLASSAPGYLQASAAMIARPMPLPTLTNPKASQQDTSLWDALPIYELDK